MSGRGDEGGGLRHASVVVVQSSRHSLNFVRGILASLKIKRYRSHLSARAALRDMRHDPPSLIIADWETKSRSAYQLIQEVRASDVDALRSVPILVLGTEICQATLDVALDAGASSVAVMPLSATGLRRRIEMLLQVSADLVEHDGRLIPSSSKNILESRLRANESPGRRRLRLELQAALQEKADLEVQPEDPAGPTPEADAGEDAAASAGEPGWRSLSPRRRGAAA